MAESLDLRAILHKRTGRLNWNLAGLRRNDSRVFRFGGFEANEAVGELRKQGVRIKLHSQPFQVLIMLLEKPSQLVTREEMRQRLWGEDTFVDFDHGLNTAINKVREALNDSASQPRYVETVSGKGYRFIAPVTLGPIVSKLSEEVLAVDDSPSTGPSTATPSILTASRDLPVAPRALVRTLLLLAQAMYLAFYVGALANLQEIHEIILEARVPSPGVLVTALAITATVLIPVRLFLFAAVAFDFSQLAAKFSRLFPALLLLDLLWALSPFLLIHHVSIGLALGMSAALVYMPFAQRSLILMYARRA